MTKQEFKAWFSGFTEAFDGKVPSAKQWARIKQQVEKIDNAPEVPQIIYRDRWWYDSWYRPIGGGPTWISNTRSGTASLECKSLLANVHATPTITVSSAWLAQGRADAEAAA